jgi:hypothetical protein
MGFRQPDRAILTQERGPQDIPGNLAPGSVAGRQNSRLAAYLRYPADGERDSCQSCAGTARAFTSQRNIRHLLAVTPTMQREAANTMQGLLKAKVS